MKAVARRQTRPPARRLRTAPAAQPSVENTRTRLIVAAERLFAEQGVGVSSREIGKAAGQSNKSVVAYHFGSKADLVLAITRHHAPDIEQRRAAMVATLSNGGSLGDWLTCIVKPITGHLESLGRPTWYARFLAGATTDPALRSVVFQEALTSAPMRLMLDEVNKRLPALPPDVLEARGFMSQHLIVNACADYERALHARAPTPYSSWPGLCAVTVDALLGLWRAPVRRSD
ncbi:MAG: TetR family transcriptional regulator [Archangium sp.]|nr:TetR family transcriptional regulator [Archangium sp.]